MKKGKIVGAILAVFVTLPIWFYLLHFMLKASGAGDLQWFLFWAYVPIGLFVAILNAIANSES